DFGDDLLAEDDETEKTEEKKEEESIIFESVFTDLASTGGRMGLISPEYVPMMKDLLNDRSIKRLIPRGIEIALSKVDSRDSKKPRELFFLYKKAELEGKYLQSASVQIGKGYDPKTANKPYVSLTFNKIGAKKFERVSGQNINKRLAIVLDGVVYVAPTIQDKIRNGKAQITGGFTLEEANDIVIVLKAGNLPAPVNIIEERTVGPTLGSDSIQAGILAAIYGLAIVALFMLIYYGLSGLIADIAVAINMLFVLAALTIFEGTLTMPGIAGLILTIGMAVDANVLIFERIREELKKGKTVRTAINGGFAKAIVTILDANITTLITAFVLFQFGTGPIKGFAVTLSIGIVGSLFCSIILVKATFDSVIANKNRKKLSI
ncbi:MAG: protein translocase subunit SecD, partial [Candidatus Cloacimonadota bacterium]|nr:protein translocase subunit SecD [Candidatus Cloacimonadota bacterium]